MYNNPWLVLRFCLVVTFFESVPGTTGTVWHNAGMPAHPESVCVETTSAALCVCVSQTLLGPIVLFAHSGNIRNEACDYKLLQWFEINPGWLHQMKHQWFNKSFSLIVSDQYESMMKPHQPSAHTSLIVSRSWIQIRIHVSLYEMTFLDSNWCNYIYIYIHMFYTRINTYIHIDYYRSVDTCIICLLMVSISIYYLCHTMCFLHLFTSFTTKLTFIPISFWSSEQSWWQRARTTWQHPKRPSPSAHQTGFQSWHCGWSEGSRQMN